MASAKITSSGQVSLPAAVRRRWGTDRVIVEDRGDNIVLRPLPADPIAAALGSLSGPGLPTEAMRMKARDEDVHATRRVKR